MCLAVAACSKDELPGTHGEFASLTLSVASSQNDVKTRAVSADADEQRINNLYIFIFNPQTLNRYMLLSNIRLKIGSSLTMNKSKKTLSIANVEICPTTL